MPEALPYRKHKTGDPQLRKQMEQRLARQKAFPVQQKLGIGIVEDKRVGALQKFEYVLPFPGRKKPRHQVSL
ncbi:hypothetical protein D3C75_1241710 [compost metagenome]